MEENTKHRYKPEDFKSEIEEYEYYNSTWGMMELGEWRFRKKVSHHHFLGIFIASIGSLFLLLLNCIIDFDTAFCGGILFVIVLIVMIWPSLS